MNYIIGLDLGQASDYTAVAVLQQIKPEIAPPPRTPEYGRSVTADADPFVFLLPRTKGERTTRYDCVHLERFPLGTSYPTVAARVEELLSTPALKGRSTLVVDNTGVGRPVVDLLRQQGLGPVPVTITGGDAVSRDGPGYRVPKRDLVAVVQVLLQTKRVRFAAGLADVAKLVQELLAFRVKISAETAHDSYGAWREGSHDDLVLALAVAVWYGEKAVTPWAIAA